MPNEIIVRNANRCDIGLLVRFNQAMAIETEDKQLEVQVLSAGINAVFDDTARGFYLAAEIGGVVVGSLLITYEWSDWRNGVFWWVQSVYVEKEYRRRGVFRAMYKEIRQRAIETDGVCGCRLYVERENVRAQSTYLELGFEQTPYILFEDEF